MGSATEAEYHVLLAKDLGYLDVGITIRSAQRFEEVKRMLASLLKERRGQQVQLPPHLNTEN